MDTTFIYALCEPGTRTVRYIGKANDPNCRLKSHLRNSIKMESHLGYWLRSIQSIGEKPHLIILSNVPLDQWESEETRYIQAARMLGMDLVNSTDGGEGMNNPSEETRAKMAAAKIGKPRTPETRAKISNFMGGENNPNLGKKASVETRALQSAARTGKKQSPETIEKRTAQLRGEKNFWFGKKHTPEMRAANSAAHKGKKPWNLGEKASPETRARQSESQKRRFALNPAPSGESHPGFGKPQSPETIAKRSAALTGKTRTPEQCAAMSAAKTGEKNPMFGKRFSPEHSANLKAAQQLRRAREKELSHE